MNGRPSRITDIAATQKFDRPRAPWPTRQRIACRARSPSARHSRIGPAANRRALVTPRQARRRKATHWQRLRQAQRQRQPRRSQRRRIPYRRPLRWQPRRSPPIRPAQSRSIVPDGSVTDDAEDEDLAGPRSSRRRRAAAQPSPRLVCSAPVAGERRGRAPRTGRAAGLPRREVGSGPRPRRQCGRPPRRRVSTSVGASVAASADDRSALARPG